MLLVRYELRPSYPGNLQQRVNFVEKYLSMLQLLLVLISFLIRFNVVTCCPDAPSQWGLRQKVQTFYAGEAPWVHALRAGEAWVLHSCQK